MPGSRELNLEVHQESTNHIWKNAFNFLEAHVVNVESFGHPFSGQAMEYSGSYH